MGHTKVMRASMCTSYTYEKDSTFPVEACVVELWHVVLERGEQRTKCIISRLKLNILAGLVWSIFSLVRLFLLAVAVVGLCFISSSGSSGWCTLHMCVPCSRLHETMTTARVCELVCIGLWFALMGQKLRPHLFAVSFVFKP